jgi:hypothetical protein
MKHLIALLTTPLTAALLAAILLAAPPAGAASGTYTASFSATNFTAAFGGTPTNPVTGGFTVTFDPTQTYLDNTAGISGSQNIALGSTLGFTYYGPGSTPPTGFNIGEMIVGGIADAGCDGGDTGTECVQFSPGTNDFYLQINNFATTPTFVQLGYTTTAGHYFYTTCPTGSSITVQGPTILPGAVSSNSGTTRADAAPQATSPLVAAVLPASRSVEVGCTATAFATMINSGAAAAPSCSVAPAASLPLTFLYQTTNPTTNAVTGTANTPVNIPAGASQSFVIALTPTGTFNPTNLAFNFACANIAAAPSVVGLNTLLISASSSPVPDIVALGATAQNDGIVHVTGSPSQGSFAVATVNLGAGAAITATANTGGTTLPLSVTLCQTNPASGQCTSAVGSSVNTTLQTDDTPTFAIFVSASGSVPFDPANNRITVQFTDANNIVRGETSVAVETQ